MAGSAHCPLAGSLPLLPCTQSSCSLALRTRTRTRLGCVARPMGTPAIAMPAASSISTSCFRSARQPRPPGSGADLRMSCRPAAFPTTLLGRVPWDDEGGALVFAAALPGAVACAPVSWSIRSSSCCRCRRSSRSRSRFLVSACKCCTVGSSGAVSAYRCAEYEVTHTSRGESCSGDAAIWVCEAASLAASCTRRLLAPDESATAGAG